jgi:peroxiredoxin
MKRLFLICLLFGFGLFPALGFAQQTIPDITLQTTDGNSVSLRSYLSKGPVQFSFWALWCEPSKQELKVMSGVYDSLSKAGYTLVAICEDNQKSVAKVRSFVSAKGWNFPVLLDPDGDVLRRLNGQSCPFTLIADKDGKIRSTHVSYMAGDEITLEKEIHDLLSPYGGTK